MTLTLYLTLYNKEALQSPLNESNESQVRHINPSPDSKPASEKQLYLNSFKVETSVGTGFAIVKPYLKDILSVGSEEQHTIAPTVPVLLPATAEPYQLNLSVPYHRHCTRTPQMSFGDFKIRATPDKLEIHCAQHRIRENLEENYVSPLDKLALGALTVISTIVFVGGSVAFSGSILLGILVAAALPIPLRLIADQPSRVANRKAILRLAKGSKDSNGGSRYRALLSLTTLPVQRKPAQRRKLSAWGPSLSAVLPTESKLHFSQVTVSAVKLSPILSLSSKAGIICYQVSFLISDRRQPSRKQLSITGTYREVKWLSRHLSQWGNLQNREGAVIPSF